jgi:excisionase family DNA binding protein
VFTAHRRTEEALQTEIPRSTFYRWLERGAITTMRAGKKILIPPQNLEQFIEACKMGDPLV